MCTAVDINHYLNGPIFQSHNACILRWEIMKSCKKWKLLSSLYCFRKHLWENNSGRSFISFAFEVLENALKLKEISLH